MENQRNLFSKKSLLVAAFLLLSWVVFFYDYYSFNSIWFIGLFIMLIIGPVIVLGYYRIYRGKPLGAIMPSFSIGLWIGIILLSIDPVELIWSNIQQSIWQSESFFPVLNNIFQILLGSFFSPSNLSDLFKLLFIDNLPYFLSIGLLFWSDRIGRKSRLDADGISN